MNDKLRSKSAKVCPVVCQVFSMTFSGINTAAFAANDHIGFNRDLFQQR